MRGKNENKQTIHDHYVQKYNLREPKILLYDLSQVLDINSVRRADLQINGSENGCNINMDDDIPLKYLLHTKSENNGMNSIENVRLVFSNTKPVDVNKINVINERLHFKKRNIKSIIYKFIRLQHKLYKITNLKLICRKCNKICYGFECFERHCASKHKYTLRKENNLERNAVSNEISPNSCSSCCESFKNYSRLRKHVKRKHNLKLNHRCEICAQNYRSKTLLKLHLEKHELKTQIENETEIELTTEPRVNIAEDNSQGNGFLNLRIKQEIDSDEEFHFEKSTVKSVKAKRSHIVYLCTLCSKTFQLESEFRKHRQVLKCSFTCNECGHVFRRHYRIREHMIKYHQQLYIPIRKIRRIEVRKHNKKDENNIIIPNFKSMHSAFKTPTEEKLKELKIIIKKTSAEELKNKIREIETNNNSSNSIEKARPISRKHKTSHSSRLLFNPLNKHNNLKSVNDLRLPKNMEFWNTEQIPVEENVTAELSDVLSDSVGSKRKRKCSKTDVKENLSINELLNSKSIVLIDKPEKSVSPIPRELRERNTKSKVEVEEKDHIDIPIRRRSTRLSSHKAENCHKSDEVVETVFVSKQNLPVKPTTRKKSVAELKKDRNSVKRKATKHESTDTDMPKRVTRKSSQTNQKENATVTGNTLSENGFPLFTDCEQHFKEETKKVNLGLKQNSSSENSHKNTPLDEIFTTKDEIVTRTVLEIEVPLFKDENLVHFGTENVPKLKLCQTANSRSGKRSVKKDMDILEKNVLVSIPDTKEQEPLLTPEEMNSLIKEEPTIKEEIINFNEYIGPTTGNSRHKYKCLICDRTFGNYNNALRHVGFKHFNKYPCIQCPESFAEERQLKIHKEQEHTHKPISLIPNMEIKTSPHREEDIGDHVNESFETHSLSFMVQNGILPEIKLKSSPHYEMDPVDLSEHITLLGNEPSNINMMKNLQSEVAQSEEKKAICLELAESLIPVCVENSPLLEVFQIPLPSEQKKSIDLKLADNLIPLCVENSPMLEVYQIPLPITDPVIVSPTKRSKDALVLLERKYSPLKSSELFCNEYEDESIQQLGRTVLPENKKFRGLDASVMRHNESYFKTSSSLSAAGNLESIGCSEKERKAENKTEKPQFHGRKRKFSTASGSALRDDPQNNEVCRRNFDSTNFSDANKKRHAKETVDSSNKGSEKDFDLPENLYKGWFETKSIDPSNEISFDKNNEVTFSEVGIEFS